MLLCIAHDPGVRLRDIAARTGVTERTAYGIDLTEAGYVVKHEDSRRNRRQLAQIRAQMSLAAAGKPVVLERALVLPDHDRVPPPGPGQRAARPARRPAGAVPTPPSGTAPHRTTPPRSPP
jgi:hypothetical protein